jgi:nucleotide-binding universal stress UspA family protein
MNGQNGADRELVVGVDGSESSRLAVLWAVAESEARHCTLRLVHVWRWPLTDGGLAGTISADVLDAVEKWSETVLAEAADLAAAAGATKLVTSSIGGHPGDVLVGISEVADLVVLGHRGKGGFGGLMLGSVAGGVTARAHCPVVVVRGQAAPEGPIVVGVDDCAAGERALETAFEEAFRRDAPLVAVRAWDQAVMPGPGVQWGPDPTGCDSRAVELVDRLVSRWEEKYPTVAVERRIAHCSPAAALVELSGRARMVVVGSRGRGALRGLLLGSVTQAVIHHGRCPVQVVHGDPMEANGVLG